MMNWSRLLEIPCWTPLRELGFEVRRVRDMLFRVEADCYLIAVQHNEQLEMFVGVDFITSLLWAESEGAALRAALKEIENDRIVAGATPPREMLLPGASMTYGSIMDDLKATSSLSDLENSTLPDSIWRVLILSETS